MPDGTHSFDARILRGQRFASERELQDYIALNVGSFCRDFLGDELVSFEQNYPIEAELRFDVPIRRVDMLIRGKNGTYIVELKNPPKTRDNRAAIGQLLDYGREFPGDGTQLLLISTCFDLNTAKTIEHYGLPIRYIYIERKRILEYLHGKE